MDKPSMMQFNLDMRNFVFKEKDLHCIRIYVNGNEIIKSIKANVEWINKAVNEFYG